MFTPVTAPITYRPCNIFASGCEALINPVNSVGVMGAGLALAFKQRYPTHFLAYRDACRRRALYPGTVHTHDLGPGTSPRWIYAVPTKRHWRTPSRIDDIERSVSALVEDLVSRGISSVAVPRLGCGLGGLAWSHVHAAILPAFTIAANRGCSILFVSSRPNTR